MPPGDGFGPSEVSILPAQKFDELRKVAAVGFERGGRSALLHFHPGQKGINKELCPVGAGFALPASGLFLRVWRGCLGQRALRLLARSFFARCCFGRSSTAPGFLAGGRADRAFLPALCPAHAVTS